MIICPFCNNENINAVAGCDVCGFVPGRIDGFVAWAPELAEQNDGFLPEAFERLSQVEAGHFWFRARNELILWSLKRYFPGFESLIEVGCGTGFVLSGIAKAFPSVRLVGSEIFTAGLAFSAQRVPEAELVQMDARKLPYVEEFDVVGAFDVIEHILEDELVLQNFHRAIKPGGGCIITVPQHQWLWSPVDDEACHKRRYSAKGLRQKVEAAGFQVLRSTSFVTLLLPIMLLSRLNIRRTGNVKTGDSLHLHPFTNRLFEEILAVERMFIKARGNWPIGGSRLIVLRKT